MVPLAAVQWLIVSNCKFLLFLCVCVWVPAFLLSLEIPREGLSNYALAGNTGHFSILRKQAKQEKCSTLLEASQDLADWELNQYFSCENEEGF